MVPGAIEEIDAVALVQPGTGSDESMAEAKPDANAEPDGAYRDDTGDGGDKGDSEETESDDEGT